MKHLKLFESSSNKLSIEYYAKLEKDYNKLYNNLKSYFDFLIDFLDKKIETENVEWGYCDDDGHWTSEFEYIDINGDIVSNTGSVFLFEHMTTQSQFAIIEIMIPYVQASYKYQKIIIDNNPELIPEIIDNLNPKIKKEYKHLGSGKDLNLL